MPRTGSIATFDDPDALGSAVHNCNAKISPTRRGQFIARLALANLPDMSLCVGSENLPRRADLSFPPHRYFVRLVAPWDRGRSRGGVADVPGTIVAQAGTGVVEDVLRQPVVSRSISMPLTSVLAQADLLFDAPQPLLFGGNAPLRPPHHAMLRLIGLHRQVVRFAIRTPARERAQTAATRAALWDALIETMACSDSPPGAALLRRGQGIMRRVLDFVSANDDRPISLSELCAIASCSAKSLEMLFLRSLGETPNRFMRRWRLWRAREALAAADPEHARVSEIAVSYGFWELGRFSVAYRGLFGESPSQTLQAAPSSIDRTSAPSLTISA